MSNNIIYVHYTSEKRKQYIICGNSVLIILLYNISSNNEFKQKDRNFFFIYIILSLKNVLNEENSNYLIKEKQGNNHIFRP
jgi:hypothetical protein